MISEWYNESVSTHQGFHERYPLKWVGDSTFLYKDHIKNLVKKHNAKSMLDYGCGKGWHYVSGSKLNFGTDSNPLTFDQYLGIDEVYKYDPCVPEFNKLPSDDKMFDCIILTQSIEFVPDEDISWVKTYLSKHCSKFCFIGMLDPEVGTVKPRKAVLFNDKEYFKVKRTKDWYKAQFQDWEGPELVLYFKS